MEIIIVIVIGLFILFIIGQIIRDLIQQRQYLKQGNDSRTSIIEATQSIKEAMARDEKYIALLQGYSNQLAATIEDLTEALKGYDLDRQVDFTYEDHQGESIQVESRVYPSHYIGFPVILLPLRTLKNNIDAVIEEGVKGRESRERIKGEMEDWGL